MTSIADIVTILAPLTLAGELLFASLLSFYESSAILMLKWVHIAISNAKRNFLGVYPKINGEYLQNYLDEFVYKLIRRYFKSILKGWS